MLRTLALATSALVIVLLPAQLEAAGAACGFVRAFSQPDEHGTRTVRVYRGDVSAGVGGARPFAFVVPDVKVNTDGTRISYNADDPRARTKAINDIRNAYRHPRQPVSDFESIRDAGWKPTARVWQVLSSKIIEKDARPGREGRPCLDDKNFLISETALRATSHGSEGDCDQTKWVDALTVPALVIPGGSPFLPAGAQPGNVVIGLTLAEPRRMALGIVGDTGPEDEIGEASVEMNRILNGLPSGAIPANGSDAIRRFQGPKTVFIILPGGSNRIPQPINADTVQAFAQARFDAWGGRQRLEACLPEIPEAH